MKLRFYRCASVLVLAAAILSAGCGGQLYNDAQRFMPGRITPRRQWVVSSNILSNPSQAADGDRYTAATSSSSYAYAELTIDLGKECLFNMVAIDHGLKEYGHARTVAVLTSSDGTNFTQQAAVPGLRRVTTILLVKPVLARYVKLRAVAAGSKPWSIGEVYLN